jgi:hypothetical protein
VKRRFEEDLNLLTERTCFVGAVWAQFENTLHGERLPIVLAEGRGYLFNKIKEKKN